MHYTMPDPNRVLIVYPPTPKCRGVCCVSSKPIFASKQAFQTDFITAAGDTMEYLCLHYGYSNPLIRINIRRNCLARSSCLNPKLINRLS